MAVHSPRDRPLDLAMTAQAPDNLRNLRISGKDQRGRFAVGNAGKPRGAVSHVTRELSAKIRELGPTAIEKLIVAVNNSEKWALEFVLNRLIPAGRIIQLHNAEPEDISEALKSGDISSSEAAELSTTLAKLNEIGELNDYRSSLAEIEKLLQQQTR